MIGQEATNANILMVYLYTYNNNNPINVYTLTTCTLTGPHSCTSTLGGRTHLQRVWGVVGTGTLTSSQSSSWQTVQLY